MASADTHAWGNPEAYEAYIGRWSRPAAAAFLAWLGPEPGGRWLDVGCGTGALIQAILTAADPREVVGVDPSPDFIAAARDQIRDDRIRLNIGHDQALPVSSDSFDTVVAGLALNLFPEPAAGIAEMRRAARRGGVVAAYVWDYAEAMEMVRGFWRAAGTLDSAASAFDQAVRYPFCRPEPLRDLFHEAGLRSVMVEAIDVPTPFVDFDDYWLPHLLPGSAPAQRYVATLSASARVALRERLRTTLPIAADGTLPLSARAWAVRGTK
jgi:SAM-dependent methyltransferase